MYASEILCAKVHAMLIIYLTKNLNVSKNKMYITEGRMPDERYKLKKCKNQ